MSEAFAIALGPAVVKVISTMQTMAPTHLAFIALMLVYTAVLVIYRCAWTHQASLSLHGFLYPIIPFLLYILAVVILPYVPVVPSIVPILINTFIGAYVVGLVLYVPMLTVSNEGCGFPTFADLVSWIYGTIKDLFLKHVIGLPI